MLQQFSIYLYIESHILENMKIQTLLMLSGLLLIIFLASCTSKQTECTTEAKVCPDGTSVGRNPDKNCEFNSCPLVPEEDVKIGQKIKCGGWDTYGEVVCNCDGEMTKSVCPSNAVCDSGQYYCNGTCGICKCSSGGSDKGLEEPCSNRDSFFR
jgi:hypothetical protein